MYFSGCDRFVFDVNLDDLSFNETQRFIAMICKMFIDIDFNAFVVCSLHTKKEIEKAKTLSVQEITVLDPKKFLSKKKLLFLKLPENEEESTHILCTLNKFIPDINAVEYPFIAFSTNDYNTFMENVIAESRSLVAPRIIGPITDNSLSNFTSKYHDDIAGIITVFDNYLTLIMKKVSTEHLIALLEKTFAHYDS